MSPQTLNPKLYTGICTLNHKGSRRWVQLLPEPLHAPMPRYRDNAAWRLAQSWDGVAVLHTVALRLNHKQHAIQRRPRILNLDSDCRESMPNLTPAPDSPGGGLRLKTWAPSMGRRTKKQYTFLRRINFSLAWPLDMSFQGPPLFRKTPPTCSTFNCKSVARNLRSGDVYLIRTLEGP